VAGGVESALLIHQSHSLFNSPAAGQEMATDQLNSSRFPLDSLERLRLWATEDTYNNLVERQDGPFGEYGCVGIVEFDGRRWMRMRLSTCDASVDLELLASGYIGKIVPVD
jgi:hypothetical protein